MLSRVRRHLTRLENEVATLVEDNHNYEDMTSSSVSDEDVEDMEHKLEQEEDSIDKKIDLLEEDSNTIIELEAYGDSELAYESAVDLGENIEETKSQIHDDFSDFTTTSIKKIDSSMAEVKEYMDEVESMDEEEVYINLGEKSKNKSDEDDTDLLSDAKVPFTSLAVIATSRKKHTFLVDKMFTGIEDKDTDLEDDLERSVAELISTISFDSIKANKDLSFVQMGVVNKKHCLEYLDASYELGVVITKVLVKNKEVMDNILELYQETGTQPKIVTSAMRLLNDLAKRYAEVILQVYKTSALLYNSVTQKEPE